MEWVKLSSRYYCDPAVMGLPDADTEVLFTRGLAYAGEQETGGFIPEHVVGGLCRRRRYRSCVDALVAARLWTPVRGGWRIAAWAEWQGELEAIVARRVADRDRKRRQREARKESEEPQFKDVSRDMSAERPGTVHGLSAPREEEGEGEHLPPSGVGGARVRARSRGTRIPDDFAATEEMITWARENTPSVGAAETARFVDYWRAQPGQRGVKVDWLATWRNWMRRAQDDYDRRGSPKHTNGELIEHNGLLLRQRTIDDLNRRKHYEDLDAAGTLPAIGGPS